MVRVWFRNGKLCEFRAERVISVRIATLQVQRNGAWKFAFRHSAVRVVGAALLPKCTLRKAFATFL